MDLNMEELEKFRQLGLIDEIALRNYKIRSRFQELRTIGNTMRDIEYMLSEEFFLSPESIHRIRYDRSSK